MKFSILTLFPNFYDHFLFSIIKRATQKNLVSIEIINFRNFSSDKHQKVDDKPFGGGAGMVLQIEPIYYAIQSVLQNAAKINPKQKPHVVLLSPSGTLYDQKKAYELLEYEHLVLVCGHYEGFDERINHYVNEVISIGDYVLSSGEVASFVIMDSLIRLVNDVINQKSLENESFHKNSLLDYPNYTKPQSFLNHNVPKVLLSGNHKEIAKYRLFCQLFKTAVFRNDLYQKYLAKTKKKNS